MALVNCPLHGMTYDKECPECKKALRITAVNGCSECDAQPGQLHTIGCPRSRPGMAYRDKTEEWDMRPRPVAVRPVLQQFAEAMEAKLRKNDHKSGWRQLPIEALFKLLMVEIEEFKIAHEFFGKDEARKELVDMANFCMMVWDRLSMEEDKNNGATK